MSEGPQCVRGMPGKASYFCYGIEAMLDWQQITHDVCLKCMSREDATPCPRSFVPGTSKKRVSSEPTLAVCDYRLESGRLVSWGRRECFKDVTGESRTYRCCQVRPTRKELVKYFLVLVSHSIMQGRSTFSISLQSSENLQHQPWIIRLLRPC